MRFILSLRLYSSFIASRPGPELIKLVSSSTRLNIRLIMLMNVKMLTNDGILIFISMINYNVQEFDSKKSLLIFSILVL